MSSQKPKLVTIKDLLQEGRKRLVFFALCVLGVSYFMSLTSASVLVNVPMALLLVVILRYFSLDFEMRRKAIIYKASQPSLRKPPIVVNKGVESRDEWKRKVDSPAVEKALDQFTRHLISEWVTDLWYNRITPDKQGPEELVGIINGVMGEISFRVKNVNLIDLFTRDIINLLCAHLKTFRAAQGKMKALQLGSVALENQDIELKKILAAEDKLHPALFSPEAEHKVLQHMMNGLILYTFKLDDLQCTYFRYTVRELIACAVMRPVLNLASPRFINERIENVVKSRMEAKEKLIDASEASQSKGMSRLTSDLPNAANDSVTGVELVSLKDKLVSTTAKKHTKVSIVKDPLLSVDTISSRSWSSMPSASSNGVVQSVQGQPSKVAPGDVLDNMSHRKTQTLASENTENKSDKAKNVKKNDSSLAKEVQNSQGAYILKDAPIKTESQHLKKKANLRTDISVQEKRTTSDINGRKSSDYSIRNQMEHSKHPEEAQLGGSNSSSYTSENDEVDNVTGLDSPEIKVWGSTQSKNFPLDHIHHPLESSDAHTRKSARGLTSRTQSGRKRFKVSSKKVPLWKEVQRTSFLSGDGQDILKPASDDEDEESSDEYETENLERFHSSLTASSSSFMSVPESQSASANNVENVLATDSFLRLQCEVTAANIVRSDSGTFAVYSVSVTDANHNHWSIKRRFRHFEELHRRLKKYQEYKLHLPPKHFLSTGSDMSVIQERSQSLYKYLKSLMQLPTVSSAVEVWDFLNVDSQTYTFSDSFSIIETLPVRHENSSSGGSMKIADFGGSVTNARAKNKDPRMQQKRNSVDINNMNKQSAKQQGYSHVLESGKDYTRRYQDSEGDVDEKIPNNSSVKDPQSSSQNSIQDSLEVERLLSSDAFDPAFPAEWVPPNLSGPLLSLVDALLHIEDGGWIRRKAFWMIKQLLHLGMGDALDDWLLEKLQRLRQGSVIASGIKRIEQILWPDGIFITKHPKRQRPPNASSPMSPSGGQPQVQLSPRKEDQNFEEQQRQEADRRARLVHELMIEKAPTALVNILGRKEYDHCAKDLYFFIQSAVCLKQLAFEVIELLLVSAFPELQQTMKELHEQKHMFGKLKED